MRTSLLKVVSLIAVAVASVFLFVKIGQTAGSPLIIGELRFRGPNGANDEFVEIYNNNDTDHTVTSSDGSWLRTCCFRRQRAFCNPQRHRDPRTRSLSRCEHDRLLARFVSGRKRHYGYG